MTNIHFSSNKFLEDAKYKIKELFHNQEIFARHIGYSRKSLNRVLNSGDEISIAMICNLCDKLNLNFKDYLY